MRARAGRLTQCRRFQSESNGFILRRIVKRVQALLLLCALLFPAGGVLAAAVFPATASCCCGAMCPMHRSQKSQHEKIPCQGGNSSPQTCMCAPVQQNQAFLPQFSLKALLPSGLTQFHLLTVRVVVAPRIGPVLICFTSPPDQPPRL